MKKIFIFLIFMFTLFSFNVYADNYEIIVTGDSVNVRNGAGTSYGKLGTAVLNEKYTLLQNAKIINNESCTSGWYKINYKGSEGYICSTYASVYFENKIDGTIPNTECEQTLASAGFPSSYWPSLCFIKSIYPNWNFIADNTNLDFNEAVYQESLSGLSRIETSYDGYKSIKDGDYDYATDTFIVKEGTDWFNADSKVVAYYLDPRNWLSENYLFMFESLEYNSNSQSENTVKAILNGRDINEYYNIIYSYSVNKINPNYIASKIRQETGGNYTNNSLKGEYTIIYKGSTYSVYNPYNIGAGGGSLNGLKWAAKEVDSYQRPWISREIAIKGGIDFITSTYYEKGQDTIYYQKFNVASDTKYDKYAHQYMQNIRGAASEGNILYGGYNTSGLINSSSTFIFTIPVYNNMPQVKTELPNSGNPNNHLNAITVNGTSVEGFSHDIYEYTVYVTPLSEVNINANTINSYASVQGIGTISLPSETNDITLTVSAQNGNVQNYILHIIKTGGEDLSVATIVSNMNLKITNNFMNVGLNYTDSDIKKLVLKQSATANVIVTNASGNNKSGKLVTGDKITVRNGSDSSSYSVVILGDSTGDGDINIADLLKVKKQILGYINLENEYNSAADVNADGKIDIADLLKIKKHILGYLTIG